MHLVSNIIFQELVASNPEPRNWKGIVISILCILFVILLVVASVVWMTPPDPGPRVKGERIPLETILDGKFKPNPFNASWFAGTAEQYFSISEMKPLNHEEKFQLFKQLRLVIRD